MGRSIFPCFILLMVSSVTQGTSDHHSCEKMELFQEKLTPFHSVIKRSVESSCLHLESCSKVRKSLHETGWRHICIVVSLLEKKKRKKSLSPPQEVCTRKICDDILEGRVESEGLMPKAILLLIDY